MKQLSDVQLAAAASLMASALEAATIQSLIRNRLITNEEGREIYEQALLILETNQTRSSSRVVFEAAREMIEEHLQSK
jgi:hypothetical protein